MRFHRTVIQSPRARLLSALIAGCFAGSAFANPVGPSVVAGQASFAAAGKSLTVTNSPNAIINWQGFSIGAGEITRFQQQSAASAVLNRVVGQDPSAILGTLSSNGRVYLVNPNGILFGLGSRVDVAGLVATTLNLSNNDFLAGRLNFEAGAVANSIVNQGEIVSASSGRVLLIAPDVQNYGLISSPQGEVLLAAGKSVQLVEADLPSLKVEVQAGGEALNVGQIIAEGGRIGVYAGLINQRGVVRADSASMDATGRIVFRATGSVTLDSGSVTAASGSNGGSIEIGSPQIANRGEVRADGEGGRFVATATANSESKGATGFMNTGGVSANAVEVITQGQAYAFGVANEGEIHARESVSLAARDTALVNPGTIAVDKGGRVELSADLVTIGGTVLAPGGTVGASAGSVYHAGRIDVSNPDGRGGEIRIGTTRAFDSIYGSTLAADGRDGGTVTLDGGALGRVLASGDISARGTSGAGGRVAATAWNLSLFGGSVSADGATQGGTIWWGGAGPGERSALVTADVTRVTPGATLSVQGATGGQIILYGKSTLDMMGAARAQGAGETVAGGLIELSSQGEWHLASQAKLDAGAGGTLLIDPKNITIDATGADVLGLAKLALKINAGTSTAAGSAPTLSLSDNAVFGGYSVAMSADRLAVGSFGDATGGTDRGAVYLFDGLGTGGTIATPRLAIKLAHGSPLAPGGAAGSLALVDSDRFGFSVALAADRMAVGAYLDDTGGANRGSVYLFDGMGSSGAIATPRLAVKLAEGATLASGSLTLHNDSAVFGVSVALSADRLAVGAMGDNTGDVSPGAVYLFDGLGTSGAISTPRLAMKLASGFTLAPGSSQPALNQTFDDRFGIAVSVSADRLAVGAYADDTGGINHGAVYLFDGLGSNGTVGTPRLALKLVDGSTLAAGSLTPSLTLGTGDAAFGVSVSLSADRMAVGTNGTIDGSTAGKAYLFDGVGSSGTISTPRLAMTLANGSTLASGGASTTLNLNEGDHFGNSVVISGGRLAIGALGDAGGGSNRGAVYLFDGLGSSGTIAPPRLATKLASGSPLAAGSASALALADSVVFGVSVALYADRMALGAAGDDTGGTDRGAVYLFDGLGASGAIATPRLAMKLAHGAPHAAASVASTLSLADGDNFGASVALAADRLAIGASLDDTGGADRGAVYLFDGLGTSGTIATPRLAMKLANGSTLAAGGAASTLAFLDVDRFGISVSLSGERLAVGTYGDNAGGLGSNFSGAAYLFDGLGASGTIATPRLAMKLVSGSPLAPGGLASTLPLLDGDIFGYSVAISGGRLAVGAIHDDTGGGLGSDRGAVYLFDGLGASGAIATPRLAMKIADGSAFAAGSATPNPLALGNVDQFGISVALASDRLAIGARFDDTGGNNRGAVYLFDGLGITGAFTTPPRLAIKLAQGSALASGGTAATLALLDNDFFGQAVALAADRLAVTAHGDDTGGPNRGAAYLFDGLGTSGTISTPRLATKLGSGSTLAAGSAPSLTLVSNDLFGYSAALAADRLAVGALFDDTGGTNRGAVYLFDGLGASGAISTPRLAMKLAQGSTLASGGAGSTLSLADNDSFGISVALSADRLAVGAYADSTGGTNRGAVYLFDGLGISGTIAVPRLATKLAHGSALASGSLSLSDGDGFGTGVALAADRLAVGAYRDDTGANDRGAVYLFDGLGLSGAMATPRLATKLAHGSTLAVGTLDLSGGIYFGQGIALSADRLAVGSYGDNTGGTGRGAAYLFDGLGTSGTITTPRLATKLVSGSALAAGGAASSLTLADGDGFGVSVALSGDRLAVGAYADDTGGTSGPSSNRGAAYLFDGLGSSGAITTPPRLIAKIASGSALAAGGATDTLSLADGDQFGISVALAADRMAVGAYEVTSGAGRGALYLFQLLGGGTSFSNSPTSSQSIAASSLASFLATGQNVVLQANNDITLNSALTVNNVSGDGGSITMQAGRSIVLNSNITSDNGAVTLVANERTANGVVNAQRDAGSAVITMASGTTLNAGNANISMTLNDGAGLASPASSDITLANVTTAGTVLIRNLGPSNGSDIAQQTGTAVTAGALLAVANHGSVLLDQGTHLVNTLAGTAAGDFKFKNGQSLTIDTVAGVNGITSSSASLNTTDVQLTVTSGSLTVNKGISATGASFDGQTSVSLTTQAGGIAIASSVTATAGGADDGGNGMPASITMSATGGAITLGGALSALGGNASTGITKPGGAGTVSLTANQGVSVGSSLSATGGAGGNGSNSSFGSGGNAGIGGAGSVSLTNLGGSGTSISLASATIVASGGQGGAGGNSTATSAANGGNGGAGGAASVTFASANDVLASSGTSTVSASAGGGGAGGGTIALGGVGGNGAAGGSGDVQIFAGANLTFGTASVSVSGGAAGAAGTGSTSGSAGAAGVGVARVEVGPASGNPAPAGDITVHNITADDVNIQQESKGVAKSILRSSASSLVTANQLLMEIDDPDNVANGSIGTAAAPVRIQVSKLEAHTHEASSGIFIDSPSTGDLQVGGLTPSFFGGVVRGVQNVTSGDIKIGVNGTLTTLSGPAICGSSSPGAAGGPICTASGNVTLRANDMVIGHAIAGTGTVSLAPYAASGNVYLEDNASGGVLSLTPVEINLITAGTLEIGRSDNTGTGFMVVDAFPDTASVHAGTVKLYANDIFFQAPVGGTGSEFAHHLQLRATNNLQVTDNSLLLANGANLALVADNDNSGAGTLIIQNSLGFGNDRTIKAGTSAANTATMLLQGETIGVGGSGSGATMTVDLQGSGTQTVTAASLLDMLGGSIEVASGSQIVSANSVRVRGGSSFGHLWGGTQSISADSGGIQVLAGTGTGNNASIEHLSTAGTQTITVNGGGTIAVTGGSGGSNNFAQIRSNAAQSITASGISLRGGTSGGGFGSGNFAQLRSDASQSITVGSDGLSLTGGGGTLTDNFASVYQAGLAGSSQTLTVNGGGTITLQGGTSSQTNLGTTEGRGSFAFIRADGTPTSGDAQAIAFTSGGSIDIAGGQNGSRNSAGIRAVNGSQSIIGSPGIYLRGGYSGGVDQEGNYAVILANNGSQSVTSGVLNLYGGEGGTNNYAAIVAPTQSITVHGDLLMHGGGAAATANTGGGSRIGGLGGASPTATNLLLSVDGNLTMYGNSDFGASAVNSGSAIGSGIAGGQTTDITMTVGGDVTLQSGTLSGSRIGSPASSLGGGNISVVPGGRIEVFSSVPGVISGVRTSGDVELRTASNNGIQLAGATVIGRDVSLDAPNVYIGWDANPTLVSSSRNMTVNAANFQLRSGNTGAGNFTLLDSAGDQTISAQAIQLEAGDGGGGLNTGNFVQIRSAGNQNITAGSGGLRMFGGGATSVSGGGSLTDNFASVYQSGTAGTSQTITLNDFGIVKLVGGSTSQINVGTGHGSWAYIRADGDSQTIRFTGTEQLIDIRGGTVGSGNSAGIRASRGTQTILGSPVITLAGGANGGLDGEGNFAVIESNAAVQSITAGDMTLTAGAGGVNNYAIVRAPVQDIRVHGNLTLTGGGSAATATTGGGVRIGGFGGTAPTATDLTLSVDGDVMLTGGSVANSGAAIGSGIQGGQTTAIAMDVGGNVTLDPGSVANSNSRIGSPASAIAAGDVSVTAGGTIALNSTAPGQGTAIRTLGNVTLDAASITQGADSVIIAGGLTTLNGGTVSLTSATNDFGTVRLNTTGNVALADLNAIDFGTSSLGTGSLTLNASGAITQSGSISAGAASFNAGSNPITLTNSGNDFTGVVSLNNSGANNVAITDANALTLGISSVGSGTLTIAAGGAITQTGALTQAAGAGLVSISAGASDITLTNAGNDFTGVVSTDTTGNVAITDANSFSIGGGGGGGSTTASFTLNANGAVSQSSAFTSAPAVVVINAGIGPIVLNDPGNSFTGNVSVAATTTGAASFVNTNAVGVNFAASSVGGALSLTSGGPVTQTGAITVGGTATINAGSNPITLTNSGNDFTGAVSLTGSSASIRDTNALSLGGASLGSGSLAVIASGAITQSGFIAAGAASFNAGSNPITLTDSGNFFTGAVSLSGTSVSITDANALTLGAVNASSLTATAPAISQNSSGVIVSGTSNLVAGSVALTATANDFGTVTVTSGGNVALTDANAITIGTSSVGGTFNISAASTSFLGGLSANNYSFSGGTYSLNAGTYNFGGTTTVAGAATVIASGATINAAGGTVNVSGVLDSGLSSLTAGTVNVLGGGTLKGTGTIVGNVNNSAGTVSPGASPGILTINGNYTQGSSAVLAVDVGGTTAGTQYDQLVVIGNVSLGGNLQTTLFGGYTPLPGDSYTFISATGTISGSFANVNQPPSLQPPLAIPGTTGGSQLTVNTLSPGVPAPIAPTYSYTVVATQVSSQPVESVIVPLPTVETASATTESTTTTTTTVTDPTTGTTTQEESKLVKKPPACT